MHGHKLGFKKVRFDFNYKKIKLFIVGHFHPAITLQKDGKKEKYKCFLLGKLKYFGGKIIILFFPLVEGCEILQKEKLEENYNLKNFEVFVIGDRVYDFGKVRHLKDAHTLN